MCVCVEGGAMDFSDKLIGNAIKWPHAAEQDYLLFIHS